MALHVRRISIASEHLPRIRNIQKISSAGVHTRMRGTVIDPDPVEPSNSGINEVLGLRSIFRVPGKRRGQIAAFGLTFESLINASLPASEKANDPGFQSFDVEKSRVQNLRTFGTKRNGIRGKSIELHQR